MKWLHQNQPDVRLSFVKKKQTCLVIGSNSFSGACFVDHLLQQGYDVLGSSRSIEPNEAFLPYSWQPRPGKFSFHQYDLNQVWGI